MRLKFKFPLNMPDVKLKRNSIHSCPLVVGFPNPVRKMPGRRGKEPESDQAGAGKPRRGR